MRLSLEAVRLSASLVIGALLFPSVSAEVTTTTALTLATKSGTVSGLLAELPGCAVWSSTIKFAGKERCGR
jgi:hypothetical protein